MAAAELDILFAAIRRTRDPELLATLFERTAPWLLHRAQLLLGNTSLAEDVVQDLFLALLENGHGCEPGRPCLPYLLGMLHRRAAHVRRQHARTLAQSLREAAAGEDAPLGAAIGAEGRAAVRQAIDALPEPYRDVVRRFLAQQSPSAIARELDRTANAVRVQLHRGLRLLRAALPHGLLVLLWTVPASPLPAQAPRRPLLQLGVATLAAGVLVAWLGSPNARTGGAATTTIAAADPSPAEAPPAAGADGTAAASGRSAIATPRSGALVFELRHADGSPAPAVSVLAHAAGRDPDFAAIAAVSDAGGRVILRDVPGGTVTVRVDRGVQFDHAVPAVAPAPPVVTLPAGADVAGIVRDAAGRPAAGAGIWLCRDPRCPTEGTVVAFAGSDGRFVLRGVQPTAFVGALREGSVPARLQAVGSQGGAIELALGGTGATLSGRVLDRDGAALANACVRVARHPRANFRMPQGGEMLPVHPCAVVRTGAAGTFTLADLPPGPMQVLVRAPGHRTRLESLVLAAGSAHHLELPLRAGIDVDGEVRDANGLAIAGAQVLARGPVRSGWAHVATAPDGSFALAGLDPDRTLLEIEARGFVPVSMPVADTAGPLAVVLHAEARVVLHLLDAAGAAATAPAWELAVCTARAGQPLMPEPLAAAGEGFAAAGEAAAGPFAVRRQGTQVWLRAEASPEDPHLLRIPAAAGRTGSLVLSLPATTPEQRADLLLVLERDGLMHSLGPVDATKALLDFGRVPAGEHRAVLYSPTDRLPAIDLGMLTVDESNAPHAVTLPEYGWLEYRLRRSDREPVLQCRAFVTDQRGLRVPLREVDGRVALVAGKYQLWASSLSFPTVGHAFAVTPGQQTTVDLEMAPGKVRHVAFRLPPQADPEHCRARVRATGETGPEGGGFPFAGRGFDTTADGLCYTTVVLGDGEYLLDVQCGERCFRSRFGVAGEDGVAQPIAVELAAAH